MEVPLQIVFEDIEPSDFVEQRIRKEAERLERYADRITSCRVAIRKPHRRNHKGAHYDVHIHVTMPGKREIAVTREPGDVHAHEDPYVAIRDAFSAAQRQVEEASRVIRQDVKTHQEDEVQGRVTRLFPQQDYGFIEKVDGVEVYFHRNAVEEPGFNSLSVGSEVRFRETTGEFGIHANLVRPVGAHHLD